MVAFSFMLSCMTDVPFGAILAGVGLYITSQILDQIDSLGNIRYVLPTHYFDAWDDLVTEVMPLRHGAGALCSSGTCSSSRVIGLWWFSRKDILS